MALLNSSNVDFSVAIADVTLVFLSILSFTIVLFSFRKILSLLNSSDDVFDNSSNDNMGYGFKQWSNDMDYFYKKR